MVQDARTAFGSPPYANDLFKNTLHINRAGTALSVAESVDYRIDDMHRLLTEMLEDNTFDSTRISKEGQRMDFHRVALLPILSAAEELTTLVSKNGGHQSDYVVEHRGSGKSESIDLRDISEKLTGAVNNWIMTVSTDNNKEMSDPIMPLAINHEARYNPEAGITRLTEILVQTKDGWQAKNFLGNVEASSIIEKAESNTMRPDT